MIKWLDEFLVEFGGWVMNLFWLFMEDLTEWRVYKVDGEFGIDWYWFGCVLEMENVTIIAVVMPIWFKAVLSKNYELVFEYFWTTLNM